MNTGVKSRSGTVWRVIFRHLGSALRATQRSSWTTGDRTSGYSQWPLPDSAQRTSREGEAARGSFDRQHPLRAVVAPAHVVVWPAGGFAMRNSPWGMSLSLDGYMAAPGDA